MAADANQLAEDRTSLAVARTIAAHDRTLMAWVRTATSLISFGFTIYKFFQALNDQQQGASQRLIGPRGLGLVMISLGVGGLFFGVMSYRRQMADIRDRYKQYGPFPPSAVTPVAAIVAALGIAGLVLVAFHM
jgi:putative membrane protein